MERMRSLTFHYFHGADAVILVFAIDDTTTFELLGDWNEDASRYSQSEIKRFLVATKSDLATEQKQVTKEKINSFCRNKGIAEIYYTSAKTGDGVDEMFQSVIKYLAGSHDHHLHDDLWTSAFPEKMKPRQQCC